MATPCLGAKVDVFEVICGGTTRFAHDTDTVGQAGRLTQGLRGEEPGRGLLRIHPYLQQIHLPARLFVQMKFIPAVGKVGNARCH